MKSLATQDAKEGKRPHFINKSKLLLNFQMKENLLLKAKTNTIFVFKAEQKILDLAEKYKELKKSGKVEKFLAKKRKKQLGKDSKHLNRNEHVRFV